MTSIIIGLSIIAFIVAVIAIREADKEYEAEKTRLKNRTLKEIIEEQETKRKELMFKAHAECMAGMLGKLSPSQLDAYKEWYHSASR